MLLESGRTVTMKELRVGDRVYSTRMSLSKRSLRRYKPT